jgi:hypothetical protein
MKIYVASSWRNTFQPGVVEGLRLAGHQVYDFKGSGDGWGSDGNGPGGFGWHEIDKEWERRLVVVYIPAMREPDLMVKMANVVTDDFREVLRLCA